MPGLGKNKKIDIKTDKTVKFLIGIITAFIITVMFPRHDTFDAEYQVGMIWGKEDLIAPFSFPIYKSETVYLKEVEEAKANVLPVFDLNHIKDTLKNSWLDSLNSLFAGIKKITDYEKELIKEKNLPEEKRTTSTQTLNSLKTDFAVHLNDDEWNLLFNLDNPQNSYGQSLDSFKKKIIQSINQTADKKIIDVSKNRFTSYKISTIKNKIEETIDYDNIRDMDEVISTLGNDFRNYFNNDELESLAMKISRLYIKPDLLYNKEETEKIIESVSEAVPKTFGIVKENERIISKHDPVNEVAKLKLESYKRVRAEQLEERDYYLQQLGRFVFVLSMLALIGVFLQKMRLKLFADNTKIILISTVILLECLLAYLSLNLEINYPIEYLIFVPVAAMLLTIIFDSRLAVYCTAIICILVSAIRGGDYDILIPNFTASLLVIYSVRDIKNRSQLFRSMIFILIGYTVTITAIGLERSDDFNVIKNELFVASLNSLLSPILTYGLLIFYERVFRVATDLVFLELSDFNHPLLRELSSKAPGTFHHSIVMGNLSEQAAKEIGANQILARVGCYYHDIGKIVSPNYFVENQLDTKNKHEMLNPSLSAKMIIAHVKNGIKLAEKYRLPQEVIDFIPMHHGTNLVSYFYQKARLEEDEEEAVHDYIYRYPGPKPHSKETGIVMLADSVEASTRAIEDPTPAKLETQIDEIIKARFIEGELDECDLTLKDLIKIKYSFLKTLVGIHHHRIKYPEKTYEEAKK
jgi:cyclic-di-AMP phosphodiesterase PgpH